MNIREIHENKKQFLQLLLLEDEQENMIDRYLERGTMYVLEDGGMKAECVVTEEGTGVLELKNIAVDRQPADPSVLRKVRICPIPSDSQFFHRSL